MAIGSLSFPHPVLGNGDDVSVGDTNALGVGYTITDEVVALEASGLRSGNAYIDELIDGGLASWVLRVACNRTYYRRTFRTTGPTWSSTIPGQELEGRVQIETGVVAASPLPGYAPLGMHSDYSGTVFDLEVGELLVLGPTFTFTVDKVYDALKAPVASLMRVREGNHQVGGFEVTYDDDHIDIRLSKADWREYAAIRDRVGPLLHSALVLPVLAEAIRRLGEHDDTIWGGRLSALLDSRGLRRSEPLIAAQQLLDSPLTRAFQAVNVQLDRSGS